MAWRPSGVLVLRSPLLRPCYIVHMVYIWCTLLRPCNKKAAVASGGGDRLGSMVARAQTTDGGPTHLILLDDDLLNAVPKGESHDVNLFRLAEPVNCKDVSKYDSYTSRMSSHMHTE